MPVTAVTVADLAVVQTRRDDRGSARSAAAVLPNAERAARRRRVVRRRGSQRHRSARDGTAAHARAARRRATRAGRSRRQRPHRQHSDGVAVASRSRHGRRVGGLRRRRARGRDELSPQPQLRRHGLLGELRRDGRRAWATNRERLVRVRHATSASAGTSSRSARVSKDRPDRLRPARARRLVPPLRHRRESGLDAHGNTETSRRGSCCPTCIRAAHADGQDRRGAQRGRRRPSPTFSLAGPDVHRTTAPACGRSSHGDVIGGATGNQSGGPEVRHDRGRTRTSVRRRPVRRRGRAQERVRRLHVRRERVDALTS